jgi:hypothetical protein
MRVRVLLPTLQTIEIESKFLAGVCPVGKLSLMTIPTSLSWPILAD